MRQTIRNEIIAGMLEGLVMLPQCHIASSSYAGRAALEHPGEIIPMFYMDLTTDQLSMMRHRMHEQHAIHLVPTCVDSGGKNVEDAVLRFQETKKSRSASEEEIPEVDVNIVREDRLFGPWYACHIGIAETIQKALKHLGANKKVTKWGTSYPKWRYDCRALGSSIEEYADVLREVFDARISALETPEAQAYARRHLKFFGLKERQPSEGEDYDRMFYAKKIRLMVNESMMATLERISEKRVSPRLFRKGEGF